MTANELWVNSDGLEVRFGGEKAAVLKGGKPKTFGDLQEVVVVINGTDVPSTDAPIEKKLGIPPGAYIEEAVLVVDTAFTSTGAATLDIGLMNDDGDGTFSTLDDNGIDAAVASGVWAVVDTRVACNGDQINTSPANSTDSTLPMVLSYGYNTAAFTAGKAEVRIKYRLL